MMNNHYILRGKTVHIETDLIKWGRSLGRKKALKKTQIKGGLRVSTVFLGIDHGFSFPELVDIEPVLFETMVFDSDGGNTYQRRYKSYDAAIRGHKRIVRLIRGKRYDKSLF